ncbi:2-iminoacetate synthase [Campylobacter suis]|uniref:2-iminoacetate synthase n=1 Tax=Campylobacter suis TaxID=2790657 RepID=A0ABN7K710_9BACT|nr:2-iminoacetate synthase [Campylobacter suis]
MKFSYAIDATSYHENMQDIGDEIMQKVLNERASYDPKGYTSADVARALNEERLSINGLKALLSEAGGEYTEQMAQVAKAKTRQFFGNSIELFTPLYISNYCDSNCVYCGFSARNKIARLRLKDAQIATELENIAKTGLKDVLILTGESTKKSDLTYIGEACKQASKLFSNVGVEIYPLNSDEYAYLHECGVDYVVVFQETYDTEIYAQKHLGGTKRVFSYRFNAQERALMGGMRSVGCSPAWTC